MLRKSVRWLAGSLAILLLAPAPAVAQRQIENPPKVWERKDVGVAFPDAIGDWKRTRVTVYNDAGTDTSVGYDLVRGGSKLAAVTIYIYPPFPIGGCDAQFADSKRSILQNRSNHSAQFLDETVAASPSGKRRGAAKLAHFTLQSAFDGRENVVMRSDSYMFCATGGKWIVAVRSSWPQDLSGIAKDVDKLLHTFAWPDALDR